MLHLLANQAKKSVVTYVIGDFVIVDLMDLDWGFWGNLFLANGFHESHGLGKRNGEACLMYVKKMAGKSKFLRIVFVHSDKISTFAA